MGVEKGKGGCPVRDQPEGMTKAGRQSRSAGGAAIFRRDGYCLSPEPTRGWERFTQARSEPIAHRMRMLLRGDIGPPPLMER
jgi:hypothetical protein